MEKGASRTQNIKVLTRMAGLNGGNSTERDAAMGATHGGRRCHK